MHTVRLVSILSPFVAPFLTRSSSLALTYPSGPRRSATGPAQRSGLEVACATRWRCMRGSSYKPSLRRALAEGRACDLTPWRSQVSLKAALWGATLATLESLHPSAAVLWPKAVCLLLQLTFTPKKIQEWKSRCSFPAKCDRCSTCDRFPWKSMAPKFNRFLGLCSSTIHSAVWTFIDLFRCCYVFCSSFGVRALLC